MPIVINLNYLGLKSSNGGDFPLPIPRHASILDYDLSKRVIFIQANRLNRPEFQRMSMIAFRLSFIKAPEPLLEHGREDLVDVVIVGREMKREVRLCARIEECWQSPVDFRYWDLMRSYVDCTAARWLPERVQKQVNTLIGVSRYRNPKNASGSMGFGVYLDWVEEELLLEALKKGRGWTNERPNWREEVTKEELERRMKDVPPASDPAIDREQMSVGGSFYEEERSDTMVAIDDLIAAAFLLKEDYRCMDPACLSYVGFRPVEASTPHSALQVCVTCRNAASMRHLNPMYDLLRAWCEQL